MQTCYRLFFRIFISTRSVRAWKECARDEKEPLGSARIFGKSIFCLSFEVMGEVQKLAGEYFMHSMYTRLRILNIL